MSEVTKSGLQGVRPDREAMTGVYGGRTNGAPHATPSYHATQTQPDAPFASYYGRPVIKAPPWKAPDIPGYLFLGGLAGTSSVLGAMASITRRPTLARAAKVGALGALSLGTVGLVHDLGRPSRFYNMLRVFKPTSPMSVGSWLLAGYGPAAGAAAFSAVTGKWKPIGALGTAGAALLGPAVASYTAALLSDTAVPAWHDGYREMPFVFVSSGATAAAGIGLAAAPLGESSPARRLALLASASELVASKAMERRIGMVAEPYHEGRAGALMRAGEVLTGAGALGALVSRRHRVLSAFAGAALVAGSACTRFGIFFAGRQSADDPKYTIVPQRERLERGEAATAAPPTDGAGMIDLVDRAVHATVKSTGPLP